MKKCIHCGFETDDDALACPSCSTDTFVSNSPEALGHIISPEEQRYWERMTFRQFAIFIIRLQALWMLFSGVIYSTYLLDYVTPSVHFTLYAYLLLLRIVLHVAAAGLCIRYADRIISWFVKDIIPKPPATSNNDDKPTA